MEMIYFATAYLSVTATKLLNANAIIPNYQPITVACTLLQVRRFLRECAI